MTEKCSACPVYLFTFMLKVPKDTPLELHQVSNVDTELLLLILVYLLLLGFGANKGLCFT